MPTIQTFAAPESRAMPVAESFAGRESKWTIAVAVLSTALRIRIQFGYECVGRRRGRCASYRVVYWL